MVRRDIFMGERLGRGDAFPWVKDKHLLKKVDRCGWLLLAGIATEIQEDPRGTYRQGHCSAASH